MADALRIYDHGTYKVFWNPNDGTFIRTDCQDGSEPEWSPAGPELADIHITDYCPMSCSYCYRESDQNKSTHIDPLQFYMILNNLKRTVLQIAIGGGSPQHHPNFIELLEISRSHGIVPSYTSNGLDMTDDIIDASKRLCGAVAISMHVPKFAKVIIKKLINREVPTGMHVILSRDKIDEWTKMLLDKKGILFELPLYSCIFLMHKPVGRASWEQHPTRLQKEDFMYALKQYEGEVPIGIDSCASSSFISTFPLESLPVDYLGPCDSGTFSVFIDEHLKVSPCSFNKTDIFSLEEYSFGEIWKEKFKPYREGVLNSCPTCESRSICRSCQVIPGINTCNRKTRTV